MAFDGSFLHLTIKELSSAVDCHVDKIYQPSKDELIFVLRKRGFVKRLLVSIKSGSARLHFTERVYENPSTPPNFCMLLRKYLSAARLTGIKQYGFDRVAELIFSASNELGDIVSISLICELIGNQANVILVKDGRILDALKHSDVETAKRLILPNAPYEYPSPTIKHSPLNYNRCELKQLLDSSEQPSKVLLNYFEGFSPLICRELEYEAALNGNLHQALIKHIEIINNTPNPCIIYNEDGTPFEFSYREINQYGNGFGRKNFESFSVLLDAFYFERDNLAKIKTAAVDIIKLVNNLRSRTEKKLSLRLIELKKCENRENLRIYGELIKANLHLIKNGDSVAIVPNYYDPQMAEIKIPLNPALSPAKNAEKYFKDYKKTYTAQQALTQLTEKDKIEIEYFESVADSISRCTALGEISEIRQELVDGGYIKATPQKKKTKQPINSFKELTSQEGFKILIGKNNLQNDYITTKLASKSDMWFHVKNIPGSHVVVFCSGQELSKETIFQAATLAAENSKASNSASVAVDYTPIKYVKKPNGAKPGMVIYTTNKTIYVTPQQNKA